MKMDNIWVETILLTKSTLLLTKRTLLLANAESMSGVMVIAHIPLSAHIAMSTGCTV